MKYFWYVLLGGVLMLSAHAQAGTTVIFEAGFGSKAEVWQPVVQLLPKDIKVINYTRPNLLEKDAAPTSIEQDVRHLLSLVKNAALSNNVILVGHSYGGLLATEVAYQASDIIDALVLVDPTTRAHRHRFNQLNADKVKADDLLLAKYMPAHLLKHYSNLTKELESSSDVIYPIPPQLKTVLLSSTQVHKSPMVIEETQEGKKLWLSLHNELFSQVLDGEHIRMSDVGHNIQSDRPELIAAIIQKLVTELD
ncbi:alpha/beta fold hydrolase [Pseudoalteromonas xiamenensis]|uniref:Alpha/beta hydrolase n=1 Tax=Pseudoalteromonas xiamenensis TaxID=882626 RepID=A0A975DK43_9GAMM|nr:alpha/beta hydrolase [Pseudoalteromonas xiamenensis]QTH73009.1 alpha/beta hydrolase [Pseudoalteromonas xiamenensis]